MTADEEAPNEPPQKQPHDHDHRHYHDCPDDPDYSFRPTLLSPPNNKTGGTGTGASGTGISIAAHRIDENATLIPSTVAEAVKAAKNDEEGASSYWIDVELEEGHHDQFEEFHREIVNPLPLTQFMARHLQDISQFHKPQFLALQSAAFLVLCALREGAIHKAHSVRHVSAIAYKGIVLVTITLVPPVQHGINASTRTRMFRKSASDVMNESELPQGSINGALAVWLQLHLNQSAEQASRLRHDLFDLAERMDTDVNSVHLNQLVNLKDQVLRVTQVAEEQSEVIQSMAQGDDFTAGIDFTQIRGVLGVMLCTVSSTERSTERLVKRIADLKQDYEAVQQERINKRLAYLTVLSAVFLPLTLMAGVWGMNFTNMPETRRENSYYIALASMLGFGIFLGLYFKHYGWFD